MSFILDTPKVSDLDIPQGSNLHRTQGFDLDTTQDDSTYISHEWNLIQHDVLD